MTSVLPWNRLARRKREQSCPSSAESLLLRAAGRTPYYASATARLDSIQDAAPVDCETLFTRFRDFENRKAQRPPAAPLGAPWTDLPLVAALAPWFAIDAPAVLPSFTLAELAELNPEALAAPVETLRVLAGVAIRAGYSLAALRYGAIAFAGPGRSLPTEHDRELLWRAFQIPLYTQFRGFHGEILACECEVHDGLHIDPLAAVFENAPEGLLVTSLGNHRYPVIRLITGFTAAIENRPCACGLATPRLLYLAPAAANGEPRRLAVAV